MRYSKTALLAAAVALSPLPFGSVTPMGVVALGLTVVVAFLLLVGDSNARQRLAVAWLPIAAVAGLALLGCVQAVPGFGGASGTLSVAPALTLEAAAGWGWVVVVLAVGVMAGADRGRRVALLAAAVAAGAFQALYGWWRLAVGQGEIWGRVVSGPVGRLRGTFVNSDHLALLFEIVLALLVAWTWRAWRRSRREPRFERQLGLLAPPIALWLATWAALVATGSRAGLVAAVFATVLQLALLAGRRRWWLPAAAVVVLLVATVGWLRSGPTAGLGRQLETPLYLVQNSPRFAVWKPALALAAERPWLGSGLGTFSEVFPAVQPLELVETRWDQAHNDPLELVVTGGVVALGLLALALAAILRRSWQIYASGLPSVVRAPALAVLGALPAVAVHECFDFGLTIPSNTLWFVLLLGVGISGVTASEAGASPLRSRRPTAGRS